MSLHIIPMTKRILDISFHELHESVVFFFVWNPWREVIYKTQFLKEKEVVSTPRVLAFQRALTMKTRRYWFSNIILVKTTNYYRTYTCLISIESNLGIMGCCALRLPREESHVANNRKMHLHEQPNPTVDIHWDSVACTKEHTGGDDPFSIYLLYHPKIC